MYFGWFGVARYAFSLTVRRMTRSSPQIPPNGEPVKNWVAPPPPVGATLTGQFATLMPLDADTHARALFDAYLGHDQVWDYLPYGPFSDYDSYYDWVAASALGSDPFFYAILDNATGLACGVASYLRINPPSGSIEVGHLNFSPRLQRTKASTEAMYLMMKWAFEAGYRRYEWKCDAANLPSRRAAQRLGFSYEGVFRQATVVKGRNRDTAWFACIDKEWPDLRGAYDRWLADDNFADGQQICSLADLTGPYRASSDPAL